MIGKLVVGPVLVQGSWIQLEWMQFRIRLGSCPVFVACQVVSSQVAPVEVDISVV